jgi:hypothetical protein
MQISAGNKKPAQASKENEPVFKSGKALPAVTDYDPPAQPNLKGKAQAMFDDIDPYDDDFGESNASKLQEKDFNANELLNFSDYQNKRKDTTTQPKPAAVGGAGLNIKSVLNGNAAAKVNNSNKYDGEIEINDDWGDEWGSDQESDKPANNFDYKKQNLNKLSDKELAKHKAAMDNNFKQLKPGDEGFEYDKRVEFNKNDNAGGLEDDSWGEESD